MEKKLTKEQITEVRKEMVTGIPVRFLHEGQNLDITTGNLLPIGTLVIHQVVYWQFTKETARKIAKWLKVKAVFDGA